MPIGRRPTTNHTAAITTHVQELTAHDAIAVVGQHLQSIEELGEMESTFCEKCGSLLALKSADSASCRAVFLVPAAPPIARAFSIELIDSLIGRATKALARFAANKARRSRSRRLRSKSDEE